MHARTRPLRTFLSVPAAAVASRPWCDTECTRDVRDRSGSARSCVRYTHHKSNSLRVKRA